MVGGRTEGVPGEVSPHQMGRGSPPLSMDREAESVVSCKTGRGRLDM